jgi:iron complex outermembrane receptor protein
LVTQVCTADSGESAADNLFNMPIEDLMNVEIKTVYGASRREQKVTEAPASITIVTQEEIKRFGYRTVADILEGTRSFFTTYDRNYQYVGVWGFSRPADYNNRVLVLLDGYRLNENLGGGSPIGTDLMVDADLIDHVELIRGPGSSLYGTNAQFGVVNIVTKSGRDYNTLEVQGQAASYGTVRGRTTYGKALKDGPEVLVSATGFASDGPRLHFWEFDDPSTNFGNVDRDGNHYSNLFAKGSMGKWTLTAGHVEMDKEIPTAPWGVVFGDPRTGSVDGHSLVGLVYQDKITDDFSVSARTSYNAYHYGGWWPSDRAEAPDPSHIVVNRDSWDGKWWIGDLTLANELPGGHHLTWGAESQYNFCQDMKNWDEEVHLMERRHSWNWALFADDAFPIVDKLLLNAGVRFDDYVHETGTTKDRLGLVYEYSDATILKALYGTAFRAPTAYELYYQDGGDSTKASPNLKPEEIETTELVLDRRLSQTVSVTVTGFRYRLDHLIEQYLDPADGLLVFHNGSTVIGQGGEAELTYRAKSGITATGSYSYTESEYEQTRQRPANSPRNLAKLRLMVPLIDKKLFAGIEPLYRGDVRTLAGRTAGGFTLVNLTFTYDGIVKNLDAGLSIYNLFDRHYGYPGGAPHVEDILYQDGTNVALRLSYRF